METRVSGAERIESNVLSMVSRLKAPDATAPLSTQVEHRLAAGIAIGLLQEGQRLPSETVVSGILGVSPVTLRQALDRLRARGLVRTRTGRRGGTVFTPDQRELDAMAREELSALSLGDIADLCGQVSMLLSVCAQRAAATGDDHDMSALTEAARATRSEEPMALRRAHMLFAVKLASISRSEGLIDMVLPLAGELQALAWQQAWPKGTAADVAGVCVDLVAALASADGPRAQDAADRYVVAHRSALMSARARLYVTEATQDRAGGPEHLVRRLEDLHRRMHAVGAALGGVDPAEVMGGSGLGEVDRLLRATAEEDPELVRGAGIAFAPGLLRDQPLWLNWWDSEESRELRFKAHTFNVAALRYYDYARRPWFRQPLELGRFSAYGPYLDEGGIDRVTVTVGLPVPGLAYQGSVIGADLRMGGLESAVFSGRTAVDPRGESVLLNAHGRVVVSSLPEYLPGERVEPQGRFTRHPFDSSDPDVDALGWAVWTAGG